MTESEPRTTQSEPFHAQSKSHSVKSEPHPLLSESEEEAFYREEYESRPARPEPRLAQPGLPFAQPGPPSALIRSLAPHLRALYADQEPSQSEPGQYVLRPGHVTSATHFQCRPPATMSRPAPVEPGPSQVTLASVALKGKQASKRGPSAIHLGPPVEQSDDGTIGFEKTFMVSSDGKYRWAVYICKVCLKNCDSISAVKKHLVVHTGEKPFSCRICGRKFTQKSTLKTHLKTLHGTDVM